MALGQVPWGKGFDHSWQVRLMLVAYKWVLMRTDTESGLGFAYSEIEANGQMLLKKSHAPEQP